MLRLRGCGTLLPSAPKALASKEEEVKEPKEVFRPAWLLELEPWQKDQAMFWNRAWPDEKREYLRFAEMARVVGPGWEPLLEDLAVKLLHLGWNGGFDQIKEKFGTLRFYWGNNLPDLVGQRIAYDVVAYAEQQSGQTCETCGKWGKLRGAGWLVTLCDECWEEEKKK